MGALTPPLPPSLAEKGGEALPPPTGSRSHCHTTALPGGAAPTKALQLGGGGDPRMGGWGALEMRLAF